MYASDNQQSRAGSIIGTNLSMHVHNYEIVLKRNKIRSSLTESEFHTISNLPEYEISFRSGFSHANFRYGVLTRIVVSYLNKKSQENLCMHEKKRIIRIVKVIA